MAHAIEEPRYSVVREYPGFELRTYSPFIVAQVRVPGPGDQAGNQGFRILAGYIFGKNKDARKISMTAPVTQSPAPSQGEPALAAPLASDDTYVIAFMMPKAYSLATLPAPLDPRIQLREAPGGRFAVIRYSGTWSENNYRQHLQALRQAVSAAGLGTTGSPVYARYNPPFTPWFMRRNEIWLRVP